MAVILESLGFFRQMASHWRETGAIAPSSRRLAQAMVSQVGPVAEGEVIVELGPGTGVFTRELMARHPRNQVVAIEFNATFAGRLRSNHPELAVVEGCASRLSDHLGVLGIPCERVGAVVSGLPLLSLPRDLSDRIFAALGTALMPGRRYVQFTYSLRAWRRFSPTGFRPHATQRVWLNVPPAYVLPFTREG